MEGSILTPWKADVLLQTLDAALLGTMEPHILAGLKGGVAYFNDGPKAAFGKTFVELDAAQATHKAALAALDIAQKGLYDKRGLKVIKKIRCNVNPADPECTTKSEEDWK